MEDRSGPQSDRSSAKRAAWCFAKASRELNQMPSAGVQPVDVEQLVARLDRLEPADQRAVAAVIDAYVELGRVLDAVGTPPLDPTVAETFAQVARLLLAEEGVEATLAKIGELAVQTIDGCDHAGISLVEGRTVTTVGASDDVPARVDRIQYEVDQGPCLDAIRNHEVFQSDRLGEEQRWPAFSARASQETGVASMLAFRLFVEEDTMGALNLYSKSPDAFDDESREIGSVFAAHAAVALAGARKEEQLETAMASRDVIGQAKGLLMAREPISADEAFAVLRRASQRLNVKLRDIADGVVAKNERGPARRSLAPDQPVSKR